jgi:hypothetical protein
MKNLHLASWIGEFLKGDDRGGGGFDSRGVSLTSKKIISVVF